MLKGKDYLLINDLKNTNAYIKGGRFAFPRSN